MVAKWAQEDVETLDKLLNNNNNNNNNNNKGLNSCVFPYFISVDIVIQDYSTTSEHRPLSLQLLEEAFNK